MVDCFTPQSMSLGSPTHGLHQRYIHHTEESYFHNSSILSLSLKPKTFEQQLKELLEAYLRGNQSKDVGLQGTDCDTNDLETNDPTYATSFSCPLPEATEAWKDCASSISDPNREDLNPTAHPLQSTFSTADIKSEEPPSIFDPLKDLVPTHLPLNVGPERGCSPNYSAASAALITCHVPPPSAIASNDFGPSNIDSSVHPTPKKRNSTSRWEPYPLSRPCPQAPSTKDQQPSSTSALRKLAPKPEQHEPSVNPNPNTSQDPDEALFDEFCRMPDDEELEDVILDSLEDRSERCSPNAPSVCDVNDCPSPDASGQHAEQSCLRHNVQDSSPVTEPQPRNLSSEVKIHHHHYQDEKKKEKRQRKRNYRDSHSRSRRTDPKNLYLCAELDCKYSKGKGNWKGFKTPDDMARHILQHQPPQLQCPVKRCGKPFRRYDNIDT